MPNRLQHESSLYLRQHAGNPVDWHPWGPEALALAKALDRPIFLSIGYSACHWCHVMEHESFEDAATAEAMNESFVCIKVDREERPDLDQIYMTSLQLLTREGGGWPLSVWLTPDLTPFYAGTYFPPREAYGRPSFRRVLASLADAWKNKRDQLETVGGQVAEALRDSASTPAGDGELSLETLRKALQSLKRNHDAKHGGFGHAPKFPHPVDLRLLLVLGQRFDDPEALKIVAHTLTLMARGGIYDQIGGAFARYSVDAEWLVPHFEKMLYDNALLVPVLLEAFQLTGDAFFATIAMETLDHALKEMTNPEGAFYSTQDADSEGEEGKFYVWSAAEIEAILGPDAEFARSVWGVSDRGNFEGHNILRRAGGDAEDAKKLGLTLQAFLAKLNEVKAKLYEVRSRRVWPGRDEKILTAWNGLMIAACADAGRILNEEKYREAAQKAARFAWEKLHGPDGRLRRTCGDAHPAKLAAYLEDYAFLIAALVDLYECDFDALWIAEACTLADAMIADYSDAEHGGFFFTLTGQGDVLARNKDWHDGATPSGNAVAATALFKLASLCGRGDYRAIAEGTLKCFSEQVEANPAAADQMLIALDFSLGPVREIAVIGSKIADETKQVLTRWRGEYHPRRLVAVHDPMEGDPSAIIALLKDRPMIDGRVTTYVCENNVCAAPIVG